MARKTWQSGRISKLKLLVVALAIGCVGIGMVFITKAAEPATPASNFHALPNDGLDDTDALQAAIDAVSANGTASNTSKALQLSIGTYRISRPLLMKSFVQLRGTPGQTIIQNVSTDPNKQSHVILGDAHPWAFDGRHPANQIFTNMPVTNTTWPKDSTTITLKNPPDAARLKDGEIICIRSKKAFQVGDYEQPDFVQFNKIRKVTGTTLALADKSLTTIPDPEVCKIEGSDPYVSYLMGKDVQWYAAQWVEISGITFRGGTAGFDRGLCYSCFVKQVNFEDMVTPLAMNALVKNIFTDISGSFTGRAAEIKMASSQSSFRNMNFHYIPKGCVGQDPRQCHLNGLWPIDIGERSVDITFNNLKVDDSGSFRKVALFSVGDARNVRLVNSNMTLSGGLNRNAVLEFRGNYYIPDNPQAFPAENYWIENNNFNLTQPVTQLAILGDKLKRQEPTRDIKNVFFRNNKWSGTHTTSGIAYLARHQIKNWSVVNDVFNNVAYRMVTESGSTQPRESGVKFN